MPPSSPPALSDPFGAGDAQKQAADRLANATTAFTPARSGLACVSFQPSGLVTVEAIAVSKGVSAIELLRANPGVISAITDVVPNTKVLFIPPCSFGGAFPWRALRPLSPMGEGAPCTRCVQPIEGRAAGSRACPYACPLSPAVPRSPRIRPPAWLRALIAHVDVLRCPVRGATPGVVACTHKRGSPHRRFLPLLGPRCHPGMGRLPYRRPCAHLKGRCCVLAPSTLRVWPRPCMPPRKASTHAALLLPSTPLPAQPSQGKLRSHVLSGSFLVVLAPLALFAKEPPLELPPSILIIATQQPGIPITMPPPATTGLAPPAAQSALPACMQRPCAAHALPRRQSVTRAVRYVREGGLVRLR